MRRRANLAILALAILAAVRSSPAEETGAGGTALEAEARISYLTSSSVYIDAGREEGLREGDTVRVVTDGEVLATLRVAYVSSHKAYCEIVESAGELLVGATVSFRPRGLSASVDDPGGSAPPSLPEAPVRSSSPHRPPGLRSLGLRGRIGLRYLMVRDHDTTGERYSQPALDLRLEGRNVGGSTMDLSVDMRARRTYRTIEGGEREQSNRSRIYRLATAWHDRRDRYRVTLGRQYSPTLATVSIFDGALFDYRSPRWGAGLFSGTQPDAVTFGYSTQIREHGAYLQVHNRPRSTRRWSFTTGLIGSYVDGEVNREFLYLQGIYTGPRLSSYLAQEIDYNRDWKIEAGESQVSPTSTFLSLRYRASRVVSFLGGYDNRRNVRLYRDWVTPETEFDDAYRQGAWAGVSLSLGRHFWSSLDARSSRGGSAGDAMVQTLGWRVFGLTRLQLEIGNRNTRYTNDRLSGRLHSLSIGVSASTRYRVMVTGGIREEKGAADPLLDSRMTWLSLDQDLSLGRHWYLVLSLERDQGDLETQDQVYGSISYRF